MARAVILPLFFVAACAFWAAVASDWNQEARDQILKIHNDYRRNEGGCRINKLEYDMDLESQAKGWAEKCVFEHEMIKGRGENLAYNTNSNPEAELITAGAAGWFSEKKDFTRGQHGCIKSCHYTQLVWHNTEKVGCYSTRCPTLGNAGGAKNAWYFVCFYTPMGNMVGEEPYELTCETPCYKGQTEEDGLCAGKAILPCVDEMETCKDWAKNAECENNPAYMEKHCRKSCKICQSEDGEEEEEEEETDEGTDEGSQTGAETGQGAETGEPSEGDQMGEGGDETPAECKDDEYNCVGWAASGQCQANPGYMLKSCRLSCGECEGGDNGDASEAECEDKDPSCDLWADNGHCGLNPGYMLNNCRKACGGC